jgi:hypothetical protein
MDKKTQSTKRKRGGSETSTTLNVAETIACLQSGTANIPELLARFQNFLLCKGLDVIGEGSYRRFLLKSRAAGATWAIQTHTDSQFIQQIFRTALRVVHGLNAQPLAHKLQMLCEKVTHEAQPPQVFSDAWRLCCLTGRRSDCTLLLNSTTRGDPCYVHIKYQTFFTCLWLMARIEPCIRSLVQHWLETRPTEAASDYRSLAQAFVDDKKFLKCIAQCFIHSVAHVLLSLHSHLETLSSRKVLKSAPPSCK